MKTRIQRLLSTMAIAIFGSFALFLASGGSRLESVALAQTSPTPASADFNQTTALAKLREQISGREQEPATTVFKNIKILNNVPAGRLLAVMEFGFARSLGVNCTHCHVPDKWESGEKTQKQTARDMWAMMGKINSDLLKNIKNLKSETPTVNCTTCHRGEVKPALNLPMPSKSE